MFKIWAFIVPATRSRESTSSFTSPAARIVPETKMELATILAPAPSIIMLPFTSILPASSTVYWADKRSEAPNATTT